MFIEDDNAAVKINSRRNWAPGVAFTRSPPDDIFRLVTDGKLAIPSHLRHFRCIATEPSPEPARTRIANSLSN